MKWWWKLMFSWSFSTHMAERILVNVKESLQQLRLLGVTVGHEESDESLAVRPPQLHVPLQLQTEQRLIWSSLSNGLLKKSYEYSWATNLRGAVAVHIQEVKEAPVLLIPAVLIRELHKLVNGSSLEVSVAPLCTVLEQEPACFQGMAWVSKREQLSNWGQEKTAIIALSGSYLGSAVDPDNPAALLHPLTHSPKWLCQLSAKWYKGTEMSYLEKKILSRQNCSS